MVNLWKRISEKTLIAVVSAAALAVVLGAWQHASTRASAEDLKDLQAKHEEDTKTVKRKLTAIDNKITSIAIVVDRIDKRGGGGGVPPKTLEPYESKE